MQKLAFLLITLIPMAIQADTVNFIGQKYQCFTCHGINGVPISSRRPVLAGQKKDYLVKRLKDFREGKNDPHNIMNLQARSLTDEEINQLAQYFKDQGFQE